jgi:hypothetical protein
MTKLRFQHWLPAGSIFLEEEELYSSTIKAVRRAYEPLNDLGGRVTRDEQVLYYLV